MKLLRAEDRLPALQLLMETASPHEYEVLKAEWLIWARPDQKPPERLWSIWLVLGGRGAGKTRTGAEWVKGMALGQEPYAPAATERIALVGETQGQVRDVMIEGVSGLLAIHTRWERPSWYPSRRRLEWPNGAIAQVFSAEDPEGLRGPQFGAAWSDELAKWPNLQETWDMLQFGLRLGDRPRQIVTTTPRPVPLIKRLLADPEVAVSRAATSANRFNLAADFIRSVTQSYGGTRLGRQELDGELVEESADALWTRAMIEDCREREAPALAQIVVAVDPPASSSARADSCGLVVAGLDGEGLGHVLGGWHRVGRTAA
ncbi:phage terminase large subunit-like protein [Bosea sp. OAE506]